MSTEQNKRVVLQFIDHLVKQDYEGLSDILSESFTWVIPSRSDALAKLPLRRDKALSLQRMKAQRDQQREGMRLTPLAWTCEGDRVALEAEGTITWDSGKVYNNLHWVTDGVEALDFLKQRGKYAKAPRPDIILLDLNLPKKDGREVLSEIKQDQSLRAIPVVILTTSAAEEDVLRSYDLHANCYVTKPVDLEKFIVVVQSIDRFWLSVVTLPPGR